MKENAAPLTDYEDAALWILAYEFDFSDPLETETKIKRKLKEENLGAFDPTRIDLLREFKNKIQQEVHLWNKSKYYKKSKQQYAALEDYDRERMSSDYIEQFPEIPESTVTRFVDYAVYLYYMR